MRRFLAFLLAAAILLPIGAVAQPGKGSKEARAESSDDDRSSGEDRGKRARENGGDRDDRTNVPRGERKPGLGVGTFGLTAANRSAEGDFVSFQYTPFTVENVTAGDLRLFTVIVDSEVKEATRLGVDNRGNQIRIEASAYSAQIHDNPAAVFHLRADEGYRFRFDPAVSTRSQGGYVEVGYPDGRTGRLVGEDVRIEGFDVVGEERATFVLDAPRGDFDRHRREIGVAIAKGHVGAEVTIPAAASSNGEPEEEIVTYRNVTVDAVSRPGNVTILVAGHGFEGRVVVVNLDPSHFRDASARGLRVLFDNASIAEASDLRDALDPDDDGLSPEHYLVEDKDGLQVILTVPHYSVHALTIADLVEEILPSVLVGLLAGAAIALTGALGLFRRPARE